MLWTGQYIGHGRRPHHGVHGQVSVHGGNPGHVQGQPLDLGGQNLACDMLETGEEVWRGRRLRHGVQGQVGVHGGQPGCVQGQPLVLQS
jgi:hypothetical protein